jgi:hypothetical protein
MRAKPRSMYNLCIVQFIFIQYQFCNCSSTTSTKQSVLWREIVITRLSYLRFVELQMLWYGGERRLMSLVGEGKTMRCFSILFRNANINKKIFKRFDICKGKTYDLSKVWLVNSSRNL